MVTEWWTRWPEANIGAVAGPEAGFWGLDIDAGYPGEQWLADTALANGGLPETRRARTGGGGLHYFWRYDASLTEWLDQHDLDLPSRNGVAPPGMTAVKGLDVKASGGYLVMAPSRHRLGGVYEWLDQRPTVHAPEWLLLAVARQRLTRREAAPPPRAVPGDSNERKWGLSVLRNSCTMIAGLQEGQHDVIRARARLVGGCVGAGYLGREEAEAALIEAGVAAGRSLKEVQRTVRWGLTRGEGEPVKKPPSRWEQAEQERADRWGAAPRSATLPPSPPPQDEPPAVPEPPSGREEPPPPEDYHEAPGADAWPHLTDVGNSQLLVRLHGESLRWCGAMAGEGWLVWDNTRWAPDEVRGAMRRATEVGEWWRERAHETMNPDVAKALNKWAGMTEGIQRIRGMLELGKGHPKIVVKRDTLDADPFMFNTPNLTLDLRTPAAYPPRREDLLTRCGGAPATAGAKCPTWLAFLAKIMADDQDMIGFLQRAVGYSMTGVTSEQCLFILHGSGANGKSTFIEAIRTIMGDYARNTPMETFTMRREGGIPNDIAALAGVRFLTAAESQEGMALNEALVKQATGDDVMTARFLNREFFDFTPQFKVWLGLNHKPVVRGTDFGIWRRLRLIPFAVTIPKHEWDLGLKAKLKAEAPGILQWALDGCGWWRAEGLNPPAAVLLATDAYRAEMDVIKGYLDDCCEIGPSKGPAMFRDLYKAYAEWAKDNGTHARTAKWFAQQLDLKGVREDPRHGEGRRRLGIALLVRQASFPSDRWTGEPPRD